MVTAQQYPKQAISQSVEKDEVYNGGASLTHWILPWMWQNRGEYVPPYGTASRGYYLRKLYRRHAQGTLVSSAINNIIQTIIQSPLEISGGRNLARYYNDLFQGADKGEGYASWLSKVLEDYFVQDKGAYIEIVGRGAPHTPLKTRVLGIGHLDALRCYDTGNKEFPVIYQNTDGKLHKLHWSRVVRMALSPHPDPRFRGLGLSLMSRAIHIFQAQELMNTYQVESLDDLPPKGILSISGVNDGQIQQAIEEFEGDRQRNDQTVFRNIMRISSIDPNNPVQVNLTPFSTLPDSFDYEAYTRDQVNLLALALGVDPQDIWPLTSQSMGTGTQSSILHSKGKGKTLGNTFTALTRVYNLSILPVSLEAKFKPRDTQQDKEDADKAEAWASGVRDDIKAGVLTVDEGRQLLANTVPEYRDLLTDESGEIIRLESDDVVTPDQEDVEIEDSETPEAEPNGAGSEREEDDETITDTETRAAEKDIQATRLEFEGRFEDVLAEARAGNLTRSRWGVIMRGLIARYGRRAFEDGLEHGGVSADEVSTRDTATIKTLTRKQSQYVTSLGQTLFRQDGITDAQAFGRAEMWWNKSIAPFYLEGQISADRNGVYEWALGQTEEHCTDCLRLDGQRHRLRDWQKTGWLPQADQLECKGFHCDCTLSKSDNGRARGRF